MTTTAFQVDDTHYLVPYTYETARLAEAGIDLLEGFCETPRDVISRAGDADVLWLSWAPHIDRQVLESLPRCRLVIRWGIGFEQIDIEAATSLGVAVANAPTYGTDDVAEHALAMLFALERKLTTFDSDMRQGGWSSPAPGSIRRIKGRTLGILGLGRIGKALAERAQGLGMHVIGHDVDQTKADLASTGVEPVTLEDLARRSDWISIHVPHTPQTERLIGSDFLAAMSPTSYLINTSRGKVIDETELIAALRSEAIAGAALDVFWNEPLPTSSLLRELPNVLLTPHYAGYSTEAWADLREEMCRTTIDFINTGWADTIVNPLVRSRLRPAPKAWQA